MSETPRPGWSSEAGGRGREAGDLGDEACLILLLFFCTTLVYLRFLWVFDEH